MSWKKALIPLATVPVILLLAYGFRTDPKSIPSPLLRKEAPNFRIAVYDGPEMSLASLRGKPVIVNFWASWCYPACYEEAPLVEATWRKYKDQGLVMVGVVIQDKEPNAASSCAGSTTASPTGRIPAARSPSTSGSMACRRPFSSTDRVGLPTSTWGSSDLT